MVEDAPDSLRLFGMCANMRWNFLPCAGGLYDQHPQLLHDFEIIFRAQHEEQEREMERNKRKAKQK